MRTCGIILYFVAGFIIARSALRKAIGQRGQGESGRSTESIISGFFGGLLYGIVFLRMGIGWRGILYCICTSALLVAGIIDGKTLTIPPGCGQVIGICGCVNLLFDLSHWFGYLSGALAVSVPLLLVFSFTRGIGGGDIKLLAAAGLLLGWEKLLAAVFIGLCQCMAIHGIHEIFIRLMKKDKGKGHVFALGPYLSMGIFAAMIYGDSIVAGLDRLFAL